MKTTSFKIRLTFTEPLLGSSPGNKELLEEHIASRAPTIQAAKEEIDAAQVPEELENKSTVFPRDEEGVFVWDYQVRGFFKESLGVLIELGDCKLSKWQLKRAVDSLVFIRPRRIRVLNANGTTILKPSSYLERPLRADTMQGPRVCLARSEQLPAGSIIGFEVLLMEGTNAKSKLCAIGKEDLEAALTYGGMKGFGQWRSGGYGRFTWEEVQS